jgi:UDP-N-acetyl-D-mannosaminuronate dehydrogenase
MAAFDAGWTVIGIDNFAAKVAQINADSSPVEDISDKQLQAAISNGDYIATTDFSAVAMYSASAISSFRILTSSIEPSTNLKESTFCKLFKFAFEPVERLSKAVT